MMNTQKQTLIRKLCAVALAAAMLTGTGFTTIGTYTGTNLTVNAASTATIVESGECGENVTYTLDSEGTLTISGKGDMYDDDWDHRSPFKNKNTIKKIVIKNGVTGIGHYAFFGCTALTTVTIPSSITKIGDFAFYKCTALTGVTIPGSVTKVGNYAFMNCESLKTVKLNNGVEYIGEYAFHQCSFTALSIPSSVISIGRFDNGCIEGLAFVYPVGVLGRCPNLKTITVDAANTKYSSKDGVLLNKTLTELICCPGAKVGTYQIPGTVTNIQYAAFSGCRALTDVTIPNSVTAIESGAFYDCTALTNVTVPDSVTEIKWLAFGYYLEPDGWDDKVMKNFTITGKAGSVAETYAKENDFNPNGQEVPHL